MKKLVLVLGTVVALGLGMGANGYMSTPEYQTKKEISKINDKIETNIRTQSLMVKNQKHGKKYTYKQWDSIQEELQELKKIKKELQARVK